MALNMDTTGYTTERNGEFLIFTLAELMHVHLLENPKSQFINVAKITDPYRLTSDSFLIYTKGFFNSNYYYRLHRK